MNKQAKLRSILLLDGVGAVISGIMHAWVLVYFEDNIGMPVPILRILGAIAFVFAIYSFSSAHWGGPKKALLLKGIAIANTLFCLASLILLVLYYPSLTKIGFGYFVLEIIVVMLLVRFELNQANA